MTKDDAKKIAEKYIDSLVFGPITKREDVVIIDEETIEKPYGWIFFYNTKAAISKRDLFSGLVGNGPILVSKKDGKVYILGTEKKIQFYLDEFEKKHGYTR